MHLFRNVTYQRAPVARSLLCNCACHVTTMMVVYMAGLSPAWDLTCMASPLSVSKPQDLFHSPDTGQGPVLDSEAAEWSPRQSTRSSPRAATTEEVGGKKKNINRLFFRISNSIMRNIYSQKLYVYFYKC